MSEREPAQPVTDLEQLAVYLAHLPQPVRLVIWADDQGGWGEQQALQLGAALAAKFDPISFETRPRRPNYDYYPVTGIMGLEEGEERDYGLRIIGLPAGNQMTSLLGAIQAVAFRGQQLETRTRILLHRLDKAADIELVTSMDDDVGPSVATACFSLAVASPFLRTFLIMADAFPAALNRHGVNQLPHVVINNNVHLEGAVDEITLLQHIARATGHA